MLTLGSPANIPAARATQYAPTHTRVLPVKSVMHGELPLTGYKWLAKNQLLLVTVSEKAEVIRELLLGS